MKICSAIRMLSAFFLVFVLVLFLAPNAFACHQKNGKAKPHGKQPACSQQAFPPSPDTQAYFSGPHFSEDGPRVFLQQDLDVDSGDFSAEDPSEQDVMINTRSLPKLQKGSADLCRSMEAPTRLTPEHYSYGWTDDCTDGICTVEIRLIFSGDQIRDVTGELSDQVDFVMYTEIEEESVLNPFDTFRDLDIILTEASFKRPGTNRTLVKCLFSQGGHGLPTFTSEPLLP